ncbi:DNA-binding response regulator [Candidatus Poribacteria bacterium]|nr:MAG: DNA-binding response regulator [Candidatus Poribacteria bacterium]
MARNTLRGDYRDIIGDSPQMFEVLQQIERCAATLTRVLISGETGTGKGMVARALHQNSNRLGELVSVNCAALQETLLESELFGHEKGAFTSADARHIGRFERAHNGTLFLDEIAEMPLSMQSKLLHAVEESEIERVGGEKPIPIDVRIVTATNKDLEQAIRDGRFREDLYYRLNVASISLPTLTARREDMEALVLHFLEKHLRVDASEIPQVAPSTLVLLKSYPWPGNVRELENVIESASHFVKGQMLLPEHLPDHLLHISEKPSTSKDDRSLTVPLNMTLEEVEETFIRKVLASLDGNRSQAAKNLGIGRSTLQRKLKKYEIYLDDLGF